MTGGPFFFIRQSRSRHPGRGEINITAFEQSIVHAKFETETRDRVILAAQAISAELGAG